MPTINLDFLNKATDTESVIYSDVQLDFQQNDNMSSGGLYTEPTSTDILASVDDAAIRNSLTNLFTTQPGQKLLNPVYGLNLGQFLFAPITKTIARMIGMRIVEGIELFEPRVKVVNVNVWPAVEESTYYVDLSLKIPLLNNRNVSLNGTLANTGFTFN